jgi:Methyltransferase FkbM domain
MWLQKLRPKALNFMEEPEPSNLGVGLANFKLNNLRGEFIAELVGSNFFGIDKFLESRRIERLDILHSDIQGYEVEMLEGSAAALSKCKIDYVFVATHS